MVANAENNGYTVMPGGLSRSSGEEGVFMVSNQTGGISKDTWVLGKRVDAPLPQPVKLPRHQVKVQHILPSRTGEHLFWLGRYMERSSYTIRLMRMTLLAYNEADEDIHAMENTVLSTLLKSLTYLTGTLPGFTNKKILRNPEPELLSLTTDLNRLGSLANSIQSFLSNGYAVRDRLGLDTWRILDSVSEELNRMKMSGPSLTTVYHALDNMVIRMMAFYGLNIDNMTRESTWHILNMGRFIESSTNTCTVLKALISRKFGLETDKELWEINLRCNESLVTYRYQYRSNLELPGVLNLLLSTEANPRSLIYQILKIDDHFKDMAAQEFGQTRELPPIRKKLLEAITKTRLCDIEELCILNQRNNRYTNLILFLDEIVKLIQETSTIISEDFFDHTSNRYSMIQTTLLPEI
jgi:uncharacterized alpha-E superfamily protein